MSVPEEILDWWAEGEMVFTSTVSALSDPELGGKSLLPGSSRQVLVPHITRNADALVNLLTWAQTGLPTPMYSSPQAGDAGIAETARLAPEELRQAFQASVAGLAEAVRSLLAPAARGTCRTAQGRTVPASEVPWMRCLEVWMHAVDLDSGVTGADLSADVAAVVQDVTAMWDRRGQSPDLTLVATDLGRRWGSGAVTAAGPLGDLFG